MTLSRIIKEVLCIEADEREFYESVGDSMVFKTSKLLASPLVCAQAILTYAWSAVFGLPPTPEDIRHMYTYMQITMILPPDAAAHITSNVVHETFMRWRDQDHELKNKLLAEITTLDFHHNRRDVLKRWSFKAGIRLDESKPLTELCIQSSCPNKVAVNPFTGMTFPLTSDDMSMGECARYAMTSDLFFQGARMFGGTCIVVGCEIDEGILIDIIDAMYECQIHEKYARPLVIWRIEREVPVNLSAMYDITIVSEEIFLNIPRAFGRCVTIGPTWTSLSRRTDTSFHVSFERKESTRDVPETYSVYICVHPSGPTDDFVSATQEKRFWVDPAADRDLRRLAFQKHFSGLQDTVFIEFVMRSRPQVRDVTVSPLSKLSIVAIDNRKNPLTVFAIRSSLACLGESWAVTVFCTPENRSYYEARLPTGCTFIEDTPRLSMKKFNIEDYNVLLKSPFVWERLKSLGYAHALLVQDDGLIARRNSPDLDDYLKFDYVGAPWADAPCNEPLKRDTMGLMTGNGGLSLRRVDAMLEVIRKRPNRLFHTELSTEPEDVYFAVGVHESFNSLCPSHVARFFSSEQILERDSIGFHKPWPYHSPLAVAQFLNGFL